MSKDPRDQMAFLRKHRHQESITGNIEGNAQGQIGRSLVEMEIQPAINNIELKKRMTKRRRHLDFLEIRNIPGADHNPSRVGIGLDQIQGLLNLIDVTD